MCGTVRQVESLTVPLVNQMWLVDEGFAFRRRVDEMVANLDMVFGMEVDAGT